LGLYVSGALLSLHADGPQVLGHLPFLAVLAFTAAGLLSLRLVTAVARSGHL
jgi:ubiquinone biosynthesis protein